MIDIEIEVDYSAVSIDDELNEARLPEVERVGSEVMESLRSSALLVDLGSLSYLGSSTIALMVRLWKSVRERDGRMVVVIQDETIIEILKVTNLDRVWTIVESREEAIRILRGHSPDESAAGQIVPPWTVANPCDLVDRIRVRVFHADLALDRFHGFVPATVFTAVATAEVFHFTSIASRLVGFVAGWFVCSVLSAWAVVTAD